MNCLLFQRILAIVGLGVIIGAADSWLRPTTLELTLKSPVAQQALSASTSATPSGPASSGATSETGTAPSVAAARTVDAPLDTMIDVASAKLLFDRGVVFLDARITEEFRAGHVPQAFHMTSATFNTPLAADAMNALDPAEPIVIYCGGGDCDASKNLAILLQGAGFTRIHIFEAGFPAWVEAGHPVEKESK